MQWGMESSSGCYYTSLIHQWLHSQTFPNHNANLCPMQKSFCNPRPSVLPLPNHHHFLEPNIQPCTPRHLRTTQPSPIGSVQLHHMKYDSQLSSTLSNPASNSTQTYLIRKRADHWWFIGMGWSPKIHLIFQLKSTNCFAFFTWIMVSRVQVEN